MKTPFFMRKINLAVIRTRKETFYFSLNSRREHLTEMHK